MIFELYLSKLNPNRNDLWQRPKKVLRDVFAEWYDNVPIGKDPLNAAMKNLSINAKLSKVYTNHCIRATAMETLDEGEFQGRHIMAQSGHKSESSIKAYARRCPTKKKKEMSYCLANKLNQDENQIDLKKIDEPPQAKKVPTATSSRPSDGQEVLPQNFQIIPENEDDIPDDQLINALEMIEKENAHLFQNQPVKVPENQMGLVPIAQNVQPLVPTNQQALIPSNAINVNNVANYAMANNPLPTMQFHNSTVTINYNFNK